MAKTKKAISSSVTPRGFFRVQITEDGKGVMGDSGWTENQVTNDGIRDYLVTWLGAGAGGLSVSHMALGTGGAPAAADNALSGELVHVADARKTVSFSSVASKTAQFTAAFNSAASFVTATANISNVGLFNSSATVSSSLFAGNTYASSSCATNQNVNVTYQIRFS